MAEIRAALELGHGHHRFGPEHCTPENCSIDAAIARLPAEGVIVTAEALAAAISEHFRAGRHGWSSTACATAILAVLAEPPVDVITDANGDERQDGLASAIGLYEAEIAKADHVPGEYIEGPIADDNGDELERGEPDAGDAS